MGGASSTPMPSKDDISKSYHSKIITTGLDIPNTSANANTRPDGMFGSPLLSVDTNSDDLEGHMSHMNLINTDAFSKPREIGESTTVPVQVFWNGSGKSVYLKYF